MTQGTALVTGASTGIGAIYADRLAHRGHDLILVARDVGRLEALATRLRDAAGVAVAVQPADLSDPSQVAAVAQRIASEPALTLLVNNAGIALDGNLLTAPDAEIARLIAINVTAPTLLAAAAARAFQARDAGGIVNVASVLALAPELSDGVYAGSKAFVLTLSQSLAHQLRDTSVRIQAVLPGATRTEIWARSGKDVDSFPPEIVMDASHLVDAALLGFDRGETVTIPPLADDAQWHAFDAARQAMLPNLSRRDPAPRYRQPVAA